MKFCVFQHLSGNVFTLRCLIKVYVVFVVYTSGQAAISTLTSGFSVIFVVFADFSAVEVLHACMLEYILKC